MKPKVYVAGPLTRGNQIRNIRSALMTAHWIRSLGAIPYVPHLTAFWDLVMPREYDDWLDYDFEWLDVCDAVFRVPGESPGADAEVERAKRNGQPVFYDLEQLAVWIMAWRESRETHANAMRE